MILKSELCKVKKFEDLAVTLGYYYPEALNAAKIMILCLSDWELKVREVFWLQVYR